MKPECAILPGVMELKAIAGTVLVTGGGVSSAFAESPRCLGYSSLLCI